MLSWDAESLGGCKGMMIGLEEAMVDLEELLCSSLHAGMPSTG